MTEESPDDVEETAEETGESPDDAEETAEKTGESSDDVEERAQEAPLADLARSMEAEEEESEEPTEVTLFEEMDIGELDSESVWEAVVESEAEGAGPGSGGPGGTAEVIEPEGPAASGEHVVDKRDFCHRCVYFTDPPETACSHEGTEIVEVIGSERFRVRNCPMVGESGRPDFEQD